LNLQIVREFFELQLFHVLTHWERESTGEGAPQLFVEHANPDTMPLPFLLQDTGVSGLARAVVEVRAWHADRFYASVIEGNPILAHVTAPDTRELAESIFGTPEFSTVLVISELPASSEPRARSLDLLRGLGVDHVLEFPTVLRLVLDRIHAHGNYAPSPTLQTLRLMKRYDLIRRQQLELPFRIDPPPPRVPPTVDAAVPPDDSSED
jgi:hypothetical protein